MLMATKENVESIVDLLNEAHNTDPEAIENLFHYRVGGLTKELIDHPTIQIRKDNSLGVLGLINGLFTPVPLQNPVYRVAMILDKPTGKLVEFEVVSFITM